mgnify:CR=1 FL=1
MTEPIERVRISAHELMERYPPRWRDRNKRAVFAFACPPGTRYGGEVGFSRWAAMPLPEEVDLAVAEALLEQRPGFYDYEPVLEGAAEWHVNFADPDLFFAYASGLFAQDEMQVLEHPVLGALREALPELGCTARTVVAGAPTPVLVTGVERRLAVATEPDAERGRPRGLYGNAFAAAPVEAVLAATRRIEPPTITNLIAMAAPRPGSGTYRAEEITDVLVTASTGFRAAALESARLRPQGPVVVHSGFWGCGAFGGNRTLMVTLQAIAAAMAGLTRLVLHIGGPEGEEPVAQARELLTELRPVSRVSDLVGRLVARGFPWGLSDGN